MPAAQRVLVKLIPVDAGQGLFYMVTMDPGVGIWPGPGGELPPYPDIGLPGPQPPFPGQIPHPEHPIAGGPWPSHPIFYPPGTRPPGQGGPQPPGGGGGGGGGGEGPMGGMHALVLPLPPSDPPATPPEGMPAGSTQVLVWFGPGTKPASGWVGPYASQQPPGPQGGEGGAQPPTGGEGGGGQVVR